MPTGWLAAVTDATIWGRVDADEALGVRSDGSRERHHVPLAGSPRTTPEGYLAPGVVHLATTDPAGAGRPIHAFAWDGRLLQTPGTSAITMRWTTGRRRCSWAARSSRWSPRSLGPA